MGVEPDEDEQEIRARALARIGRDLAAIEGAWAEGRALDFAAALEVAKGTRRSS
jgi:hypothetical protein